MCFLTASKNYNCELKSRCLYIIKYNKDHVLIKNI